MGHYTHKLPINQKKESEGKEENLHVTTTTKSAQLGGYGEFEEFVFIQTRHTV